MEGTGRTTDHALAQDVVERDCGDGATRRAGSSARARETRREQPSDEPAQLSYLRAGQRGRDQRPNSVLT